jgi:hypothetical protein
MKITKAQLKQIIKEEISLINENEEELQHHEIDHQSNVEQDLKDIVSAAAALVEVPWGPIAKNNMSEISSKVNVIQDLASDALNKLQPDG